MNVESNIYKRPTARVQGMSSRQQVLFLLQKTQKEANWDMENDSDFQEDYSQDMTYQNLGENDQNLQQLKKLSIRDNYSVPYNEEFEIKREKLRQQEFKDHADRFRLLAHSLTQFTPIKKNKYLERKRYVLTEKEANSMLVCNCQRATAKKNEKTNPLQSFNCGERCINRCVSTECCAQSCPSGTFCKNRRFQLHQNAYVFPAKTEKKGWGLFAGEFIPKGTFIMQYVGEVFSVDSELGQERVQKYKNSTCTYLMRTTNNEVIDPTYVGNIARFINHSCDPSCETQKWNVLGEVCVGIFSLRDIQENEELSFDYQFDFFKTPFTKCYCGTAKCKGYLGVLSTQNADKDGDNPQCSHCQESITDREEIVVCNGFCREAYHVACIIKSEGKSKSQAQAFLQNERRNYICKECISKLHGKKKRGRKNQKEIDELIRLRQHEHSENVPENPQEDKDNEVLEVPPWESKDPNVKKYFEDSTENRLLDKIIGREIDQIDSQLKDINDLANSSSKHKRLKKKNSQFSDHYNFMCELQKRMKLRIKENKKNYKFRKHRVDIRRLKPLIPAKLNDSKQLLKQINSTSSIGDMKKKRGRPKKVHSSSFIVENKHPLSLSKISQSAKVHDDNEDSDEMVIQDIEEHKEPPAPLKQEDLLSQQSVEEASMSGSIDESDDSSSSNSSNSSSSEEEEEDQEEEHDDESMDEEEDEDEYDEEDNSGSGSNDEEGELNLEKLQGQFEDEEEEKQHKLEEEMKHSTSLNQFYDKSKSSSESMLKKRLRGTSDDEELRFRQELGHSSLKGSVLATPDHQSIVNKKTPMKQIFQISPRKNSIVPTNFHQENKERYRASISNHIKQRLDDFVKDSLTQSFLPSDLLVRESKFNVYEPVFNIVVPENIEAFQCLPPAKFQIFWEQAWGGMVTVRINSTLKQYNFMTGLVQEVTDMMFKSGLFNGNSNNIRSSYNTGDAKELKNSFPFDIVMLKVPKNFIRKLVGYQEKALTQYRKNYTVDFYFDRDLLTDDVFYMNETTQLRIFGRNQDVYAVNELIQKELEQIKIKTILLQMNDCKIVMDNVKEVKVMVDPCEVRVKKMTREWKDLRHPFYYLPNYFREMVLIGTEKEIQYAENQLDLFFLTRRDSSQANVQQICFLLPIQIKEQQHLIKTAILQRCSQIQVFFYEPTFPRKHLTILIIGQWATLVQAKQILEDQANIYLQRYAQTFDMFQQFTYHQQIRFSFKSLKRFVLEQDIKYLNHWDLCSIFVEQAGNEVKGLDWHKLLNPLPQQNTTAHSSLSLTPDSFNNLPRSVSQQYISNTSPYFTQQGVAQNHTQQPKSVKEHAERDYVALVDFLKNQDVETCINSLFVLMDSKKPQESMQNMMERLQVSKYELIQQLNVVLQKNIHDYEDAVKSSYSRGGSGYYDSMKMPASGYQPSTSYYGRSYNRSRSSSGHHHPSYNPSSYHHYSYSKDQDYKSSQPQPLPIKQFNFDQASQPTPAEYSNAIEGGQVKDRQSRSRSRSKDSYRYRRDYSSNSSGRSKSGSYSKKSYHDQRASRRNHDSPDFTRPSQDLRSHHHHHHSSRYYDRRSPARYQYHAYSRPPGHYRSYRDDYRDYKYSGSSHGHHHHRHRSRSRHHRSSYNYHRRSDSEDSADYRRSHHYGHSSRDRHRSRHRHHGYFKSRSRNRSSDSESQKRGSRSHYYYGRESRGRSRTPDPQTQQLIYKYGEHPYFSGQQRNSTEITSYIPIGNYESRPKYRGFDISQIQLNEDQQQQQDPNITEEGQI